MILLLRFVYDSIKNIKWFDKTSYIVLVRSYKVYYIWLIVQWMCPYIHWYHIFTFFDKAELSYHVHYTRLSLLCWQTTLGIQSCTYRYVLQCRLYLHTCCFCIDHFYKQNLICDLRHLFKFSLMDVMYKTSVWPCMITETLTQKPKYNVCSTRKRCFQFREMFLKYRSQYNVLDFIIFANLFIKTYQCFTCVSLLA